MRFLCVMILFSVSTLSVKSQIIDSFPWLTDWKLVGIKTAGNMEGVTFRGDARTGYSAISFNATKYKGLTLGKNYRVGILLPADYTSRTIQVEKLTKPYRNGKTHITSDKQAIKLSCDCEIRVSGNSIEARGGKLKLGGKGKTVVMVPIYGR